MKIILTSCICLFFAGLCYADETEYQQKAPVRIYLEHYKNPERHQLKLTVLARKEKRYLPANAVKVDLYKTVIDSGNFLGSAITDADGKATYTLTQEQFQWANSVREVDYYAVVSESETLMGAKKKLNIKDVQLDVTFFIEDSVKYVKAKVYEIDSAGNIIPKKRVKVQFLVQRPLNPLNIGDNYSSTDENGIVSTEFPDDLPGDKDGHLNIIVRIIDDDYGMVDSSTIKQWGIPTLIDDQTLKRSLWASGANAPISLLIFINSLILGVWGMICYIIYNVFIINKIGKNAISVKP